MMVKQKQLTTESVEDKQEDVKGNWKFSRVTKHTTNSSAVETGCTPKGTMTEKLENCYWLIR